MLKSVDFKRGVYIGLHLSKISEHWIKKYQEDNLKGFQFVQDLHCTLIWSRHPFKGTIQIKDYRYEAKFKRFSLLGDNNVLVMEIDCPPLIRRFNELNKKYDFIREHIEYIPHITLAYKYKGDLSKLPEFKHKIYLQHEFLEEAKKVNDSDLVL